MQQMQGNMRGFGMGGQQFRQFFAAGARSSLLGPVPMGVAIKSPMMGFPPARPVYPHVRYYNNTSVPGSSSASASTTEAAAAARQSERKRDIEQITHNISEDQPGPSTATEANEADNTTNPNDGDGCCILSEEQLEEPEIKKQKTHGLDATSEHPVVCVADADGVIISSDSDSQPEECTSIVGSEVVELENEGTEAEVQGSLSLPEDQHVDPPTVEAPQDDDCLLSAENQDEEDVEEGTNKFYCYLCSITCLNQQNFRSHMNSISHQQRMMEIQHMSNACLVTLLPRLQDSLQGTSKDSEKKNELKRWCATCRTHFSSSSMDHRQTKEHKLARKMAISSCTVCKKHFRSSHIFIQHLQTLEHRKKVEMDNQDSEELSKIPDGFLVEESGMSGDEEDVSNADDQEDSDTQDGGASREVTLEDMDDSVLYDPNEVYGSSFFVPVAGFICRLCNKFYHFESSDLHSHCKSLEHYENLKRYKSDRKCETSQKCVAERELNTDFSTPTTERSSKQPFVSLRRLQKQADPPQSETGLEPSEAIQGFTDSAPHASCTDIEHSCVEKTSCVEESTTSLTTGDQNSIVSDPAVTRDLAQSVSNEENVEEKGVKNNSKAAMTPRRRTVRATNRR